MKLKTLFYIGLIVMTISKTAQSTELLKKLPLLSNKPNCVSSQSVDVDHHIAPFKIKAQVKPDEAWLGLKKALSNLARTQIIEATDEYLHAEVTSSFFRFVDDVYAILDKEANLIQISSASRVGYSDLGVNRKRVESLRSNLQQAGVIE